MLGADQIEQIIPHRYPFLLVDRVIELEEGQRGVGIKNVTANEWFFEGHFPGKKVMPGVLIVEALAQVAAVTLLKGADMAGKSPLFGGIENVTAHEGLPEDAPVLDLRATVLFGGVEVKH